MVPAQERDCIPQVRAADNDRGVLPFILHEIRESANHDPAGHDGNDAPVRGPCIGKGMVRIFLQVRADESGDLPRTIPAVRQMDHDGIIHR
jgi:hypothetical protein